MASILGPGVTTISRRAKQATWHLGEDIRLFRRPESYRDPQHKTLPGLCVIVFSHLEYTQNWKIPKLIVTNPEAVLILQLILRVHDLPVVVHKI